MKSHSVSRLVIAGCAFGLCCAVAPAQSVAFLTPDQHEVGVGQSLAISLAQADGVATEVTPWPAQRLEWLFTRSPGAQNNRDDRGPAKAGGNSIQVTFDRPGVTMVGIDSKPMIKTHVGASFKAFAGRMLADNSLIAAVDAIADDEQLKVRRLESAKTLIRVIDSNGRRPRHSATAQSKTGQSVEIRPLADPTMIPAGGDLPVKVYAAEGKRVGVRVLATCADSGSAVSAVTDSAGTCILRLADAGVWRIEFHHLVRLTNDPSADWEIHTATLSFHTRETGEGE